jgi:hypothetical protein
VVNSIGNYAKMLNVFGEGICENITTIQGGIKNF